MDETEKTPRKLWNRNYLLVIIGQVISLFGNSILRFALSLYVLDITGSAAVFGTVTAFSMLPMIALTPIGGILADRVNKRNIMLALDISTFALLFIFGFTLSLGHEIIQIGIVMSVLAVIQAFYLPSVTSAVPLLQEKENLVPANAAVNQVAMLANVIGSLIGGILYAFGGITVMIWLGAAAFFITAVLDIFIVIPHEKLAKAKNIAGMVKNDISQSLSFIVKERPDVLKVIGMISVLNLLVSALSVGFPFMFIVLLDISSELYGLSTSLLAAAGLLGGILAGLMSKKFRFRNVYLIVVGSGTVFLPLGIGFPLGFAPAAVYMLVTGLGMAIQFCFSIMSVYFMSAWQKITPSRLLGKVAAYISTLTMCAIPIGRVFYGFLFDRFSSRLFLVFVFSGLAIMALGIASKGIVSRMDKIP